MLLYSGLPFFLIPNSRTNSFHKLGCFFFFFSTGTSTGTVCNGVCNGVCSGVCCGVDTGVAVAIVIFLALGFLVF